jgi:hypothetical protein
VEVKRDPELIRVTQEAVNRIDWTLREILWDTGLPPSSVETQLRKCG